MEAALRKRTWGLVLAGVLACLCAQDSVGQPATNAWIEHAQPYFKMDISKEGVYRISYQTLNDALQSNGFALSSIDPRRMQLFARGTEQHIFISGEADGTFDESDFIEFYARGNDGEYDTPLYDMPDNHANPYYSLFNDTIWYFLTWNSSLSNARMTQETDMGFSGLTPSPYIIREQVNELHDTYYTGQNYALVSNTPSPLYTGGEGYLGYYFDAGWTDTFWNINTANRYVQGPDAEIEISVAGLSGDNKNLRIIGPTILHNTVMQGFRAYRYNFTVPTSELGTSTSNFTFAINNTPANFQYRAAVGYVKVRFPKTPDAGGAASYKFFVPNNPNFPSQPKSLIQLTSMAQSGVRAYDLTNHRRLAVQSQSATHTFLIPDNGTVKEIYVTHEGAVNENNITSLRPAGPAGSVYFTDFGALNPATDYFAVTNSVLLPAAQEYASYRNSTGHNAIAIDADELYAQFAWGIRKHPRGIKEFARWAVANYQDPKHLFLIGKAVTSRLMRTSPEHYAMTVVPTFGHPPSDVALTSYISPNTVLEEPALATGRLAAQNVQQVQQYLQKMQEYESLDDALWMKRVVHLSGGGTQQEVTQIRNFMDSYKAYMESPSFGADVITFQKTSSAPFQITQVDSIRQLINSGVQMTNFFGHGSGVGFDVSIDHPSTFQNSNGKYPFMVANSCFAGDIFQPTNSLVSLSEEWVLQPNGGALGFFATVGPGNKFYLHNYATRFVRNLSQDSYGETLGTVAKHTVRDFAQPNNEVTRIHNLEFTLHGDPAHNITDRPLPDLMVSQQSLYTLPAEVTTEADSFQLNIVITNLGRAFTDSFVVEVARQLPNQVTDLTLSINHAAVSYIDTMRVMLPVDLTEGLGINRVSVRLNATQVIDESTFGNNFAYIDVNVLSPDIVPIYPHEFAVVPNQGVTLKANTGNPFAPVRTYRMEIDTTDLFNSLLRQHTTVTQSGGVVTWQPQLLQNMPDSTVYFWRASLDSATSGNGQYKWRESSFQYIPNRRGWGQAHFFQYKKDRFNNIDYNRPERTFDFVQTVKQLQGNNKGLPHDNFTLQEGELVNFFVDNGREEYLGCVSNIYSPQLLIAVIDPCTLKPWETPGNEPVTNIYHPGNGNHGQLLPCRTRPEKWYAFNTLTVASMDAYANFLNNVVPDSHYVMVITWRPVYFTSFLPQYLQPLQTLGATQVGTVAGEPYILFCKKGDPGSAAETIGASVTDQISFTTEMTGCWNNGLITTPPIGPASQWGSLHLRSIPLETPNRDSIAIDVIGIRQNGLEETLLTGIQGWSTDIQNLGSQVSATEFPKLRLQAYLRDDSLASTPPQLVRWHVLYEGVPEAALNPRIHFAFQGDTLTDGQNLVFTVAIENIGDYDMDSLLVHYWVEDADRVRHNIPYARQKPLLVGDVFIDTIVTSPIDFVGGNRFWVEVNPINDQPEQWHFNNIGSVQFYMQGDRINPILDVTFDGVHILDGDIVSARPMIVMEVNDESQHRLLNDTTDFQVMLKEPGSEDIKRVYFEKYTRMQFYPGQAPDNRAKVEWNPHLEKDGVYELWVQARDKSGNASGDQFHRISFEVVNEPSITNVLNYPNPFSTRTHFVFTMTGSRTPDYFKVQILTITGKVVKEITSDEIGPMNIGRNVTKYQWDGKDRFGDQLANGVYLYRVVAKLDGDYMELRKSGADKWIHSGFGKMMLIR